LVFKRLISSHSPTFADAIANNNISAAHLTILKPAQQFGLSYSGTLTYHFPLPTATSPLLSPELLVIRFPIIRAPTAALAV
jgi:hypothetical protein